MRILPKEERFYHFFLDLAQLVERSGERLAAAIRSKDNKELLAASRELGEYEKKANGISREIYRTLHKTFITPIDPEDIHQISGHLYAVVRDLEHSSYRLVIYELAPVPESVSHLTEQNRQMAGFTLDAVRALDRGEPLWQTCERIEEIESEADSVERSALAHLFASEKDPIRLMKQKEIIEMLGRVGDSFADLAHVLKYVAVKNA